VRRSRRMAWSRTPFSLIWRTKRLLRSGSSSASAATVVSMVAFWRAASACRRSMFGFS
jgi:hypothetical protein